MHQTVVDSLRAAYEVTGDGPDVVLIHGWMASKRYWHEADKRLPGFRVWALDLYGFGDSEKPVAGYSLDNYASFVRGFLDSMGIEKTAVVGHSMGGAVAARVAISTPERLWALTLADPALASISGPFPLWSTEPIMRTFMQLADTSRKIGNITIRSIFGVREFESNLILEEARKADIRAAMLCGDMMSRFMDWQGLGNLTIPVQIIYGENDFLLNRGIDKEIKFMIPKAGYHYIPGCGHLPMLENPNLFYKTLYAFLNKNKP